MGNLYKKLQSYSSICDELFLKESLKKLIDEALSSTKQISSDELKKELDSIILIDVREPEEFASGSIKANEVLTIPRGKLEFMALDKIEKKYGFDKKVVTYCLKGPRGALASVQLQKLGFKNVYNLKGGILKWLEDKNTIMSYLGELRLV